MPSTPRNAILAAVLAGVAALALAQAQGRLVGTVTDEKGAPIQGATITLTTQAMSTFKLTLTSDKNGKFGTIIGNATWTYKVRVDKPGYVAYQAEKKIPVGDTGEIDAKLTPVQKAAPSPQLSASDRAVLSYNAGVDALQKGDRDTAVSKFLEAVKEKQDLIAGWQALTKLEYEQRNWDKVIEYGERVVDLDPTLSDIYALMAEAAKKKGDAASAAAFEKKFEEANPDSPEIAYNKGVASYNSGKMKDAAEHLKKATELKPDWAEAHYLLGMAYLSLNKVKDMKTEFNSYLKLEPNGKHASEVKDTMSLFK
jgi:tetratricopeptide (TPR) repeat protein